jgi:hypothetical protein
VRAQIDTGGAFAAVPGYTSRTPFDPAQIRPLSSAEKSDAMGLAYGERGRSTPLMMTYIPPSQNLHFQPVDATNRPRCLVGGLFNQLREYFMDEGVMEQATDQAPESNGRRKHPSGPAVPGS